MHNIIRHRTQVGSSVNPSLKRCPVNSPTTHLNWSLFNCNRSFVFLAEGPGISLFSPVWVQVWIPRFFFFVISVRPIPDHFLGSPSLDAASWFRYYERMFRTRPCQLIWCLITSSTLGTHISWTLLFLASCMREWWQSQTSFEVIWWLPSALITAWLSVWI
jgi:hypothetical protein